MKNQISPETGDAALKQPTIDCISAITVACVDLKRSMAFYKALGFHHAFGDETSLLVSFRLGAGHFNIIRARAAREQAWWGRIILYVSDVDAMYYRAKAQGFTPDSAPRDAEWGERYFHITDPDGHQLSFAKRL